MIVDGVIYTNLKKTRSKVCHSEIQRTAQLAKLEEAGV